MPKHFLLRLRDRDMWRERRAEDGQKRGVKYKHIHMGTHAHTHTHTHAPSPKKKQQQKNPNKKPQRYRGNLI